MRKYFNIIVYASLVFLVVTCKNTESKPTQTMLQGETTLLVDETLRPIVEEQVQVFQSNYDAKMTIISKSEAEIIQFMAQDSSRIAVLPRTLTSEEVKFFNNKKIFPKMTPFAKDGIALITNRSTKDTLITLETLTQLMKGIQIPNFKGLVFDNPNSSTVRFLCDLAQVKNLPQESVFSFKTNKEVFEYVAQHDGMIGVVGINHIFEPAVEIAENLDKINTLNVLNPEDKKYYAPTQNDIATGQYPLARELFVVDAQGFKGLGSGFSVFVSGEIGQRIVLKSGLVPVRFPTRKIRVRNTINK